jgi:hypothetical protein
MTPKETAAYLRFAADVIEAEGLDVINVTTYADPSLLALAETARPDTVWSDWAPATRAPGYEFRQGAAEIGGISVRYCEHRQAATPPPATIEDIKP